MFGKLKDLLGDGHLIQELQSMGIEPETLQKAIQNFPPVAEQIQVILASTDSNQVKISKVTALVMKAAQGAFSKRDTSSNTTDSGTKF